ncbi:MAG TPA: glycosyltransferase family 2 protein [Actinomycetota bacterium]|nr:glycosyltransferase family 2 protein [Actinomycetota bacterium]
MSIQPRGELDPPEISAVVCTYTGDRWNLLVSAISSLQRQEYPLKEIIVVVDHNEPLLRRVRQELPGVVAIANEGEPGLSGARNSGWAAANGSIVASLDDDAEAAPDWTARLCRDFSDPTVAGVGCFVTPTWEKRQPAWFPQEFYWVVGCTYRGVPTEKQVIRNPIGAAMALRREALANVGGFRSELGRLNKNPLGCEETELCVRIRQQDPQSRFIQDPEAKASHHVSEDRTTWRYFRSRCFAEGLSKAAVTRNVGSTDALAAERTYVTRVLPSGMWNSLLTVLSGDPWGVARAGAIVGGFLWTVAGFVIGSIVPSRGASHLPRRILFRGIRRLVKDQ